MKTYNKLYEEICSINNLANAWKKARKGKTKKDYVIEFEKNLRANLIQLRKELLEQTYKPEPLKTFILRNPKTRKIVDEEVIFLIKKILVNGQDKKGIGMPLGNLTSQFFANIYLNELDYFVKHKLRTKYYIRYVDDFVILHKSKEQLEEWKQDIDNFLRLKLKLEFHSDKSKVIPFSKGVDFVGFRKFYHFKLLRKRNIKKIKYKLIQLKNKEITEEKFRESWNGWLAYAKWANTHNTTKSILSN